MKISGNHRRFSGSENDWISQDSKIGATDSLKPVFDRPQRWVTQNKTYASHARSYAFWIRRILNRHSYKAFVTPAAVHTQCVFIPFKPKHFYQLISTAAKYFLVL